MTPETDTIEFNPDHPPTILVVDDNVVNLKLLMEYLKSLGMRLLMARDGEKTLTRALEGQPDLILLDILMPGIDGFETCRRLKAEKKTRDIPVIFMTALDDTEHKVKGFQAGAVDYITKPIQVAELFARIMTQLRLRTLTGQLEKKVRERTAELSRANDHLHREIAERKKAEKTLRERETQLRHVQKMESLGTLAGGIAHDFNNILAVISGYAEIAKYTELPRDHPASHSIAQIIRASKRAADLVRQILAFSRQTETEPAKINIHPLIKEVSKFMKASIPPTIEIHQELNAGSDVIIGDPGLIHQVLMNLCTNAVHAMKDKGGKLEISTEDVETDKWKAAMSRDLKPGAYIKLMIRDGGKGMTGLVAERIFDPYFTTKKPGEGTGLGLSVVHGIVKNMNGAIAVESEPGKGTTFCIALPRAGSYKNSELEKEESPVPGGSESLFIIDDEEHITTMLQLMLKNLGYTVTTCNHPVEALRLFNENPHHYDLVITDMLMPDMKGTRLAAEILKIRPELPVILFTGFSDSLDKNYAGEKGIQEVIMKPVVREQIAGTIRRVLDE